MVLKLQLRVSSLLALVESHNDFESIVFDKSNENGIVCLLLECDYPFIHACAYSYLLIKYNECSHIYGIQKKKGSEEPRGRTGIKTQT